MTAAVAGKGNVLGVGVSMTDYRRAVDAIITAGKQQRPLGVTALAVHGVMCGALDPAQRWRLNQFDIVTPDGQPVRWALNLLHGAKLPERVYGPDLMLKICASAAEHGLPVYFYGSRQEVLDKLTSRLLAIYPQLQVAGARPSLFRRSTDEERLPIIEAIRCSGARIVFAGLGCPRQEVWVHENVQALGMPAIAIGAAFDFHAGLLPQAPPALQKRGLEWAFRLAHEPRRLWRRYVLLNPLFIMMFLLQWSGVRKYPGRGTEPVRLENYG